MKWQLLDTGCNSANVNMEIDRKLLEGLQSSQPILHFYDWHGDCATYGYFTKPEEHFKANVKGLQLAQRPTGGGIIFHLYDLAFSVLIPANHPTFSINTLENYAFINGKVAKVIAAFSDESLMPSLLKPQSNLGSSFCMAQPTAFDLVIDGKKIGGAAQRRTKLGYLHQGSISLLMPSIDYLSAVLLEGEKIGKAMQEQSYFLLDKSSQLQETKKILRELLIAEFVSS